MSAPLFEVLSSSQLRAERDEIIKQMKPHTVDILRRLQSVDALSSREEQLLQHYDSLTWLIDG